MHVLFLKLALVVFSYYFRSHIRNCLFVLRRFGVRRMKKTAWCTHWSVCSAYWMLSSVPSVGCIRCVTVSISLCVSTAFLLVKNSLEIGCQFSTFVDFWVDNSVVGVGSLMLVCILVHNLRRLMRIAVILCSFQFVQSLVQLDISELLLNSSVCILGHASTVPWSRSCAWAVAVAGVSTSKPFEYVVLSNWAAVAVGWLSHRLMAFQCCRWGNGVWSVVILR